MPARSSSSAEIDQSRARAKVADREQERASQAPAPANERAARRLRIGVLALEGMMLSTYGSVVDTLLIAQRVAELQMPGLLRFEATLVGAAEPHPVRTADGTTLTPMEAADAADLDLLLVPGLMHGSPGELFSRRAELSAEIDCLRRLHARGVPLASACCGTFLLAEAGVLDGQPATTSWWLGAAFRHRYPDVRLDADALLVEAPGVTTAGAGSAVSDLLLRLVAKHGGEALAQLTARLRLQDPDRQSQAPYISEALIERPRSSLGERADKLLQEAVQSRWGVTEIAARLNTSERSLLRHFQQHYGESPLAHLQRLRIERAKALLETSLLSLDEIVERCGYRDTSSFRRLFKRATSMTPSDYRERYRLRRH
jgi:transcriptional regulator GlxA family with amidase domain